ncbi:SHOCT domain-containing protein [Nocardioides sp.]|uniref:SHOCT domain-containing protein n=1 Tax=Nocardioides sp. TaxID=35761 RepID=UPI00286E2570|nr:SHOCT domain-containing protein [Nocardioides sp.]
MMGWYNNADMGAGGWIAMIVVMSLFWGAVIFAGVMLFRGTSTRRDSRGSERIDGATPRDPLDILGERFARGELDAEEYEARKAVLLQSRR